MLTCRRPICRAQEKTHCRNKVESPARQRLQLITGHGPWRRFFTFIEIFSPRAEPRRRCRRHWPFSPASAPAEATFSRRYCHAAQHWRLRRRSGPRWDHEASATRHAFLTSYAGHAEAARLLAFAKIIFRWAMPRRHHAQVRHIDCSSAHFHLLIAPAHGRDAEAYHAALRRAYILITRSWCSQHELARLI